MALLSRRVFLEYSTNPVGEFMAPYLAEVIPPNTIRILFGAGLYLTVLGCCGFYAACSKPGVTQQWALSMLLLLTVPTLLLAAFGTVLALSHDSVVRLASYQEYLDVDKTTSTLQQAFFRGLKASFLTAWADCEPVPLSTSVVHRRCAAHYPQSECAAISDDYVGLFCQSGVGPFNPDSTFAFLE